MIVCSYSCPKNVLDKSAEDILREGLFWDKSKFSSFSSTFQNHSHIVTRFSLSASVRFLHLYQYKIQIKQKLTDADKEKRVTICEWCLKITKTCFCLKIGLQGKYLLLICPRHFWGNYSCKRSSIGSPLTSYNRKDIR
jgi:hypothetical protein